MAKLSTRFTECLKVRHLLSVIAVVAITCGSTFGAERKPLMLQDLRVNKANSFRAPANFIPNDEIESLPFIQTELWVDQVFAEDDAGVLRSMRDTINSWDAKEEYAKNWDLESTGLYGTPDEAARKSFLNKNILKYLDKRLAGETKNAEAGSTLAKVGQVHKALRPSSDVAVSESVKIKFKARVLQGNASMIVVNPYVDYDTTVEMDGSVRMDLSKEFKKINVRTGVNYTVTDGVWVAYVDKKLTETVTARVSSTQADSKMAMSEESDRQISLHYNLSF